MKRLAKILIITAVSLVLLLALGIWGLNHWLKSPEMHAHVERELSKALRVPLKFKSLKLSLWGGLQAKKITVPDERGNFFEVEGFSAKHSLLSLLRGRLVFENVIVDSPKFVIVQRKDGSWKTPDMPADLQAEMDAKKKSASKSNQPKSPSPEGAPTPKSKKSIEVSIAKIEVTNGRAEMIDKDGHPYISATGLRTTLTNVSEENIGGWVTIAEVVLHDQFAFTEISGNVSNTPKGLIIPEMKAKLGGGTITADFSNQHDQPGPPFTARFHLDSVNLGQAASDADAAPPNVDGILTASLELRGVGNDQKLLKGKGNLTLRDGACREMDIIRDIGEVFQMEQFANFAISEAKSDFEIGKERIFIRQLTINAPSLSITAQGNTRLDGSKLNLKAMFNADEKLIAKQLPEFQKQFLPPDENHQRGVAFDIDGSLTKPKNNLMQKITGTKDRKKQKILAIESLIFGTRPDKKPDKTVKEIPAPNSPEQP